MCLPSVFSTKRQLIKADYWLKLSVDEVSEERETNAEGYVYHPSFWAKPECL